MDAEKRHKTLSNLLHNPEGCRLVKNALDRVVGYQNLWRKVLSYDPDWKPDIMHVSTNTTFSMMEDKASIQQVADNLVAFPNEILVEKLMTGIEWSHYSDNNFQEFYKEYVHDHEGYILLNGKHYPWLRKWGREHLGIATATEVLKTGRMVTFGRFPLIVTPYVASGQLLVVHQKAGRYTDNLTVTLSDDPLVANVSLKVSMIMDTRVYGVKTGLT